MTVEEPPHLWISVVPRSNTDAPSYWWSALRFMQACRAADQMDSLAQRLLQRMQDQKWPWVRGLPDEPHAGAFTWEVPYAEIVTAEEKREASFIASQALHYMRSSLDHLIYNASWIDKGSPQNGTQFPILDDSTKWEGKDGGLKKLRGMSPQHSEWIKAVQPFNGVDWTKTLRVLSNADKHRFGVEVSPTVQLKVNVKDAIRDPASPKVKLAQIEELKLRMFLPAMSPYGDFTEVFNGMTAGAAGLINQFLTEAGLSPIEVGSQRIVSPTSMDAQPGTS